MTFYFSKSLKNNQLYKNMLKNINLHPDLKIILYMDSKKSDFYSQKVK